MTELHLALAFSAFVVALQAIDRHFLARSLARQVELQQQLNAAMSLRVFFLKGLHPGVERPEQFGPQAMANAHATMRGEPAQVYDHEREVEAQNRAWEEQAAAVREAEAQATAEHVRRLREMAEQMRGEPPLSET